MDLDCFVGIIIMDARPHIPKMSEAYTHAHVKMLRTMVVNDKAYAFREWLDDARDTTVARAALRYALMPSGMTMLMFTAIELHEGCTLIVLNHCDEPDYINTIDAYGHTALSGLFYWHMLHHWTWSDKADAVADALLGAECIDTMRAVAVVRRVCGGLREGEKRDKACEWLSRLLRGSTYFGEDVCAAL